MTELMIATALQSHSTARRSTDWLLCDQFEALQPANADLFPIFRFYTRWKVAAG